MNLVEIGFDTFPVGRDIPNGLLKNNAHKKLHLALAKVNL